MELPVIEATRAFAAGIDQRVCNGCDACGARCTAGIEILRAEFEAIQTELARLPHEERERVLGQDKNAVVPGTEFAYTACRFRDVERGRCLIYAARPLICRLFGHVEWLPCPIGKVERHAPGAVETMRYYAREPRKTYEEWLAETGEEGEGVSLNA